MYKHEHNKLKSQIRTQKLVTWKLVTCKLVTRKLETRKLVVKIKQALKSFTKCIYRNRKSNNYN